MYAIMCTKNDWTVVYYGPFYDVDAVERYAKKHHILGNYLLIKLNDCGDTMDA